MNQVGGRASKQAGQPLRQPGIVREETRGKWPMAEKAEGGGWKQRPVGECDRDFKLTHKMAEEEMLGPDNLCSRGV